ncbi:MAG: glycoside hydrolase family 57 protein [Deltaproteobacteria bacterium]|nr:glycoside hydrolase family 57 protein [Deltaproteobacteria bacterium]
MSELSLSFLWHMHQPLYRDPFTGKYTLPWVRLHAIKAYYDMPSVLKRYPGIKVNVNLVPSLVEQIEDYASGKAVDVFYEYSAKPASELTAEDRTFILKYFFMGNWETMIKPYPRYFELLLKRGKTGNDADIDDVVNTFNRQDFLDLQVWFNLSWFGFTALDEYPFLVELREKQRGFTEQDKGFVLDTQTAVMRKLLPLYRELSTGGQIEITTSPFYHTILPLLYDSDTARRSMPRAVLPQRVGFPEDVLAQLKSGRQFISDRLGTAPKGLWPSEGSVSPEIIPLVREAGFEWMVTDEEILFASIGRERSGELLYRPYTASYKGSSIDVLFRDKGISNFISFDCARYASREDAVNEFKRQVLSIRRYLSDRRMDGIVVIALDGENPWEYYTYSGRRFLNGLYDSLSRDREIRTTTISAYLGAHRPADTIDNIYTGSWINKRFDIWIGQEEKNLAWDYLGSTREYLKQNSGGLTQEQIDAALRHLYAAEGSDWFWWYGDTFYTVNEEEFDRLFRKNLKKAIEIMKRPMLDFLHTPITALSEAQLGAQPRDFMTPVLDGVPTDYYEWESGAVCYHTSTAGRHNPEPFISRIYYGFDPDNLYVRLDHNSGKIRSAKYNVYFAINIFDHGFEYRIVIPIKHMLDDKPYYELHYSKDQMVFDFVKLSDSIAIKKIIELKIPFSDIGASPNMRLNMIISARDGDVELEKYPAKGIIGLVVPDRNYTKKMWSV